jgi:hypothetical protein
MRLGGATGQVLLKSIIDQDLFHAVEHGHTILEVHVLGRAILPPELSTFTVQYRETGKSQD